MKHCIRSLIGFKNYFKCACFSVYKDQSKMSTLETLNFDNKVLKKLPIDPEKRSYARTVNGACFSRVMPTPVKNPKLVCFSQAALALLDLPLSEVERESFVDYFSGSKILNNSEPAAHCYCGHQFGSFAGQLGDGAAIYLGEVLNNKGERWEIQLKGAGLTPYSRTADGRKVLRSSIREFLCSEAMHFLGVPTTRAGSCITSDSKVVRDIFYDGHPKEEKCTIVLRIAPSFIRFGSFEIFKTMDPMTGRVGPSVGRTETLHKMLDYVIETFYTEIHARSESQVQKYAAFFKEVVLRTARLVAQWQCVGFCHGVLNTDNMSILGLTIDYGPFGFLDMYNPDHICNASDDGCRYSYTKQPEICLWNLKKLAEAIRQALPLDISTPLLDFYEGEFDSAYLQKMHSKLGLIASEYPEDKDLIKELFDVMEKTGADFTNTFLCLLFVDVSDLNTLQSSLEVTKQKIIDNCYSLDEMMEAYKPNMHPAQLQAIKAIANTNPEIFEQLGRQGLGVKRILLQMEKLEAFEDMTVESKTRKDQDLWGQWLEKYKVRISKDLKSFKGEADAYNRERLSVMKRNNPRFILRNYIAQEAIEKAENGDYSGVRTVMKLLENPYDHSYTEMMNHPGSKAGDKEIEEGASSSYTFKDSTSECREYLYDKPPERAFSIKVT